MVDKGPTNRRGKNGANVHVDLQNRKVVLQEPSTQRFLDCSVHMKACFMFGELRSKGNVSGKVQGMPSDLHKESKKNGPSMCEKGAH